MEMTIGTDTVVMLAELLSALGVIGGVVLWLFNFVQRSRRQAEELRSIRKEQTLICYGLLACLQCLKEQGGSGPHCEQQDGCPFYKVEPPFPPGGGKELLDFQRLPVEKALCRFP